MRLPGTWQRARVTLAITIVTVAAFVILSILGLQEWARIGGGFIPARLAFGDPPDLAMVPFWLTPLTATLLHQNFVHIALNMVILVFCGRPVESVLGPIAMAILYLVGAFAAAGAQYALDPNSVVPMIGASGAISAVIGAYAMLFGRNKVKVASPRLALWLNALWLLAAWVVLNVVVGLTLASAVAVTVAVGAHIGGFLIGILLANPLLLFRYRRA